MPLCWLSIIQESTAVIYQCSPAAWRDTIASVRAPTRPVLRSRTMEIRGKATDRHGRVWTGTVVCEDEAEEADFRFWYEGMTPEERVAAVEECLLSSLKAKGIHEIPRLRRVARSALPPEI